MRVSVIIPTHNEAQAIGRVLADLPADLVTEVVVVDSNSTDGTAEIAKTTAATITSFLLDRCIFPLRLSRSGPAIGQVRQPRQAIHFRTSIGYVQFGIIVILVCLFLEITLAMT